eukprot:scaffold86651_cov19-Prasinocladus_malaysianus.AAC.1
MSARPKSARLPVPVSPTSTEFILEGPPRCLRVERLHSLFESLGSTLLPWLGAISTCDVAPRAGRLTWVRLEHNMASFLSNCGASFS